MDQHTGWLGQVRLLLEFSCSQPIVSKQINYQPFFSLSLKNAKSYFQCPLLIFIDFLVMNGWSKFYKWYAERDGEVNKCEKFNMMVNNFSTGCMTIVNFAILIWGSVVVFGAWATWTDDYAEYEKDPEAMNYCMNQPMMTAFVILILDWVLIPCMIVLGCLCGCCCACCYGMCASMEQTQSA